MSATQEQTIALASVNTPPASTWNKLRVNDITLTLPAHVSTGAVYGRLPQVLRKVETGAGEEAVSWIENAAGDARYIELAANTQTSEPIVVAVHDGQVSDTGIIVREGAKAQVAIIATGAEANSAAAVRIICERNSELELTELVAASGSHEHLSAVGVSAGDGALLSVSQYYLGGKITAAGFCAALDGRKSTIKLSCRYLAGEGETLDINHLVRARGRDTREDLVTSGFLGEGARKTLRETIDLIHGAKGSAGNESETVMIAGENVVNKTLPTILCDEDDVSGNHGATIGSIGQESLAYLADRGLDADAAAALFMRAVFDDALIHAPVEEARKAVFARAEQVLDAETAHDLALEA